MVVVEPGVVRSTRTPSFVEPQIRLDAVGAVVEGALVGFRRVLSRACLRRAVVGDHERLPPGEGGVGPVA